MNKLIYGLIVFTILWGCKKDTQNFTFKITGTINGQESGQIYFMESNRVGDEVSIPIVKGTFDYQGASPYMYSSMILIDIQGEKGVFQFVVEPGEIIIELNADSLAQKSQVLSGKYNNAYQNAYNEFYNLFSTADFESDDVKKEIISWLKTNNENLMSMTLLNSWESFSDFMPLDRLTEFVKGVKDKNLKNSREYIQLYSLWLSKSDSINCIGKQAYDFTLKNVNGENVRFGAVSKDKITYVEKSGSWCGNSTRRTRELKSLYDKYMDKGFEIITVVPELKLNRWVKWLTKEAFPWTNLVELDSEISKNKISITNIIFKGNGNNFLVDETGKIIETNISTDKLKEILHKKLE